jgi:predicted patatin/cPLA2 family phospholipase
LNVHIAFQSSARPRLSRPHIVAALALLALLAGCATRPVPLPKDQLLALPWGAIDDRTHDIEADARASREAGGSQRPQDYDTDGDGRPNYALLALSGGGSRGAFGAGLLTGWSKRGTRPSFKVVTGVSTGALMATHVFLGPKYDFELERFYTTTTDKEIFSGPRYLSAVFGVAVMDTGPLKRTLEAKLPDAVIDEVAVEHGKGRRLYIGTTDLDGNRLVVWDMGAIAAGGRPDRYQRYREVLLASASIPVAFPPVYFPVDIAGKRYWQMHVDGGASANIFFTGFMLRVQAAIERDRIAGVKPQVDFYAIINGPLDPIPLPDSISPSVFAIASGTLWTTSWAAQISMLALLHQGAQKWGIGYHIAGIPADYPDPPPVANFEPVSMTKLFRYGEARGMQENPWQSEPPRLFKDAGPDPDPEARSPAIDRPPSP